MRDKPKHDDAALKDADFRRLWYKSRVVRHQRQKA